MFVTKFSRFFIYPNVQNSGNIDREKPNVSGGLFPDRETYLIELSRLRTSHVVDILGDSGRVVDLKLHMYVLHVLAETFQSKERRKERLVGREEIRSPLKTPAGEATPQVAQVC